MVCTWIKHRENCIFYVKEITSYIKLETTETHWNSVHEVPKAYSSPWPFQIQVSRNRWTVTVWWCIQILQFIFSVIIIIIFLLCTSFFPSCGSFLPYSAHEIPNAELKQYSSYSKGFKRLEVPVRLFYHGHQIVTAMKTWSGPSHNPSYGSAGQFTDSCIRYRSSVGSLAWRYWSAQKHRVFMPLFVRKLQCNIVQAKQERSWPIRSLVTQQ
jgi:hypothetical protein